MPAIVIGSHLWGDMFGSAAMRSLFSDTAMVQRYLDVEAALARAQAKIGIVPAAAVTAITAVAQVERVDWASLAARTAVRSGDDAGGCENRARAAFGEHLHDR